MASFLGGLVSGGQLGAGFSNSSTNGSTTGQFSNSGSTSGNSSTQRTLTPYQDALQGPLFQYISQLMLNPTANLAPFKTAARNNVNSNYNGLADSLRQQFLSTGGGSSGKFGTALVSGDLARRGQLSDVDNSFAQQASALPLQASSLAEQLLGMNFGQTSNFGQQQNQSGQQSGTSQSSTSGFNFKI